MLFNSWVCRPWSWWSTRSYSDNSTYRLCSDLSTVPHSLIWNLQSGEEDHDQWKPWTMFSSLHVFSGSAAGRLERTTGTWTSILTALMGIPVGKSVVFPSPAAPRTQRYDSITLHVHSTRDACSDSPFYIIPLPHRLWLIRYSCVNIMLVSWEVFKCNTTQCAAEISCLRGDNNPPNVSCDYVLKSWLCN